MYQIISSIYDMEPNVCLKGFNCFPDLLEYMGSRDLWSLIVGYKFNDSLILALFLRNFFEPLD